MANCSRMHLYVIITENTYLEAEDGKQHKING